MDRRPPPDRANRPFPPLPQCTRDFRTAIPGHEIVVKIGEFIFINQPPATLRMHFTVSAADDLMGNVAGGFYTNFSSCLVIAGGAGERKEQGYE
jgi:hypothetical protein